MISEHDAVWRFGVGRGAGGSPVCEWEPAGRSLKEVVRHGGKNLVSGPTENLSHVTDPLSKRGNLVPNRWTHWNRINNFNVVKHVS